MGLIQALVPSPSAWKSTTPFSTAEHGFYRTNELTGNVRKLLKSLKISPPKPIRGIQKHTENVQKHTENV